MNRDPIRPTRSLAWDPLLLIAALGSVTAGCQTTQPERCVGEITQILQQQADRWNEGDVDAFMETYWRSSALTFASGGRVLRGWEQTRHRYRSRYPTRDDMGRLDFSDLEITPLSEDAALVLGNWRLEREEPTGGVFSLVMRKQAGRWIIIHDHTSAESP